MVGAERRRSLHDPRFDACFSSRRSVFGRDLSPGACISGRVYYLPVGSQPYRPVGLTFWSRLVSDSDVRTEILRAASHLFSQQGYKSTSVREVVQAAGVTKPTLYYWFQNKEALFREVVQAHLDGMRVIMDDELDPPGSVRERFERFSRRYINTALTQSEAVHLLMLAMHPVDKEQPVLDLLDWHCAGIERIASVLRDGVASGELRNDLNLATAASSWLGMVNHTLMGFLHGAPYDETALDNLLDLYFNGVSSR